MGTYIKTDIDMGPSASAKVQVGKEFDIGQNMGLEISTKAQADMSLANPDLKNAQVSAESALNIKIIRVLKLV